MRKYFLMLLAAACLLTSCEKNEKHEDPQIIGEKHSNSTMWVTISLLCLITIRFGALK